MNKSTPTKKPPIALFQLKAYVKKNKLNVFLFFCGLGILSLWLLTPSSSNKKATSTPSFKVPSSKEHTRLYKSKMEAFKQEKRRQNPYKETNPDSLFPPNTPQKEDHPKTPKSEPAPNGPFETKPFSDLEDPQKISKKPLLNLPTKKKIKTKKPTKIELETNQKEKRRKAIQMALAKGSPSYQEKDIILAAIYNTQKISDGSQIKFRLMEDLTIGGITIAALSPIYGKATFARHRIEVSFSSIVYNHTLYPFEGILYDFDGWKGIAIDVREDLQHRDQKIQNEALNLDESLEAFKDKSYLAKGAKTIKKIFTKNKKQTLIELTEGHRVMLKKISK